MRRRQTLPTAAAIAGVALLTVGGVAAATSADSPSAEGSGQMMGGGEMGEMHRQHMRDPQMRELHREMMSSEPSMGSMHRR